MAFELPLLSFLGPLRRPRLILKPHRPLLLAADGENTGASFWLKQYTTASTNMNVKKP